MKEQEWSEMSYSMTSCTLLFPDWSGETHLIHDHNSVPARLNELMLILTVAWTWWMLRIWGRIPLPTNFWEKMSWTWYVTYFCGWSVRLLWEERKGQRLKTGPQREAEPLWHWDWALTHGAFPHQTDELMWPRLSCHPQEDFSEWVVGKPAVLRGKKISMSVHGDTKRECVDPGWQQVRLYRPCI